MDQIRETKTISSRQHMRLEMWSGPQKRLDKQFHTIVKTKDGKQKFSKTLLNYTPALYKIIDEIMVNAVDHVTNHPEKVTYIKIFYDINSGAVQVTNNGPGIPIHRVEITRNKNGEPINTRELKNDSDQLSNDPFTVMKWFPQWISEEPFTGNNFGKRDMHITGGIHGSGMKLANYWSEYFVIETVNQNKKYKQIMEHGTSKIHEPEITNVTGIDSYTTITFKPDYKNLSYANPTINDYATIEKLVRTRAYQIASYCAVDVHYNGQIVNVKNIADLGEMFAPELKVVALEKIVDIDEDEDNDENHTKTNAPIFPVVELKLDSIGRTSKINPVAEKRTYAFSCQLKAIGINDDKGNPLIWNVCVGPSMTEKFEHMSVVNGMYIIDGGCHIDWIANQIIKYFEIELGKITDLIEADRNRIKNNLYIVMVGPINLAASGIHGQAKEKISIPKEYYSKYAFTNKQLKEIWTICEPFVISSILDKNSNKRKTKKPSLNKYRPAKFSKDKKKAMHCSLFIPEGDSASTFIRGALTDKSLPQFTSDYYGFNNIQGVPLNARRFTKIITDPKTGERKILTSVHDNERLEELYYILGLDERKTYDQTPEGNKDFQTLHYGSVILATDQDEDGKGQITSLLINYFMVFWPALVKRGYVKRLNTPIIRSVHKASNKITSFNSVPGYKKWVAGLGLTDDEYTKAYTTNFYKGLGKHDADDIRDIFTNYANNLITYTLDERSEKLFEEYFGKDSECRKTHLRTPINLEFAENSTVISVSDHLSIDTKSFKRYVIMRMLPHAYDGLLLGRRKVFATARKVMSKNQEMNVSSLAGRVKAEMNYHHGDSAITDTITKMGQTFFPRIIPLFIGSSIGFGSRACAGHDMSEARYIAIKQNTNVTNLLFPEEDDYLLPYELEEGDRCEPKYYLPIIPMVLLETQHHPSQGWDVKTWARNWRTVFRNVRNAILAYNIESVSFTNNQYKCVLSQTVTDQNKVQTKYTSDSLIVPLEIMDMDTTGWFGKIVKVPIMSTEGNLIKTKIYSVGSYTIDVPNNTIIITELPHGLSSNNFSFGNRKLIEKAKAEFEKAEKKAKDDAKKQWDAEQAQSELDTSTTKSKGKGKKSDTSVAPAPLAIPASDIGFSMGALMKMSSVPDFSKQILSDAKSKKMSIFDNDHGNDIADTTLLQLDIDDKFHYESKSFLTRALVDKEYVKYVDDRSTDKNIEIHVELEAGGLEHIKTHSNELFDGIIEHFKLRVLIHDSLNFIDKSGYIEEFKSYDAVFRNWFDARKKLFEERFKRSLVVAELQIYKYELIQKYCTEIKNGTINISRQSRKMQEETLEKAGYPRIGTSIINDPKYIPTDQIKYEALENKVNLDYNYVTLINDGMKSEDDFIDRQKKIDKLKAEISFLLNNQKHFPGALQWLEDLDKLEVVVGRGLSEGWNFDQKKKKYV